MLFSRKDAEQCYYVSSLQGLIVVIVLEDNQKKMGMIEHCDITVCYASFGDKHGWIREFNTTFTWVWPNRPVRTTVMR